MLTPVKCLALRTVPISDDRALLSAWSDDAGRLTFAMPCGSGREARRRRALTSPMALFEGVADLRPGRDIYTLRDMSPLPGSVAIGGTPLHHAQATFLADVLDRLLRRAAPDKALADFVFSSAAILSASRGASLAHFTISFLVHLAYGLGIGPGLPDKCRGTVFDMRQGNFRPSAPLHPDWLGDDATRILALLARTPLHRAARLHLSGAARRQALDLILRYYAIHLVDLTDLASLDILRAVFD